MLAAFAAFAMLLAAMGLYGMLSYLVTQSTHDIGVLVALGARPGDIIRLVVRQGMELAAIGILAGLAGAAVLTRVMASMLFGVDIAMRPNIRNCLSELDSSYLLLSTWLAGELSGLEMHRQVKLRFLGSRWRCFRAQH